MPRPALANVSLASLHAEIERRKRKLARMVAQRDLLNDQIAELGALAGPGPQQPAPLAPTPAPKPGKKPGPKPGKKAVAPVAKAAAVKKGVYSESANEMILRVLAGGKPVSTIELAAAWKKAGRKDRPSKTLSEMVKAKKIKREVLKGVKANNYTLA